MARSGDQPVSSSSSTQKQKLCLTFSIFFYHFLSFSFISFISFFFHSFYFSHFFHSTPNPHPKGPTPTRISTPKRANLFPREGRVSPEGRANPNPKGPTPTRRANPDPEKGQPPPKRRKGQPQTQRRKGQPQGLIPVLFSPTLGDNYHCVIVIKIMIITTQSWTTATPRRKGQPRPREGRFNLTPSKKADPYPGKEGPTRNWKRKGQHPLRKLQHLPKTGAIPKPEEEGQPPTPRRATFPRLGRANQQDGGRANFHVEKEGPKPPARERKTKKEENDSSKTKNKKI